MSEALAGFEELKGWVDQLVDIHARIREGPGRRHRQEALYRAGAVMTVAAWESYVEDLLNEALDALSPGPNSTVGERTSWALACAFAEQAAKRFNTPNAQNVQQLLETHLDADVTQCWGVAVNGTRYTVDSAKARVNCWLDIRHRVAHGGNLPDNLSWIKDPSGKPRLTLALMRDCRDFFWTLARESDVTIASHLVTRFGLPAAPW